MKEYLMGLFALSVCCAVVEMLSPSGEGGGIARHIKLMSALCLLCVMLAPLTTLLREGDSLPDRLRYWAEELTLGGEETQENMQAHWEEQCEKMDVAMAQITVADMLKETFSLADADCRVGLTVQDGVLTQVRVALSGKAIWANTHEIQRYIEQTFGCASEIYIE